MKRKIEDQAATVLRWQQAVSLLTADGRRPFSPPSHVLTRSCFGGVCKQELAYLEAASPPLKREATSRLPLSPPSAHRQAPQFTDQFVATNPSSSNSSCSSNHLLLVHPSDPLALPLATGIRRTRCSRRDGPPGSPWAPPPWPGRSRAPLTLLFVILASLGLRDAQRLVGFVRHSPEPPEREPAARFTPPSPSVSRVVQLA